VDHLICRAQEDVYMAILIFSEAGG